MNSLDKQEDSFTLLSVHKAARLLKVGSERIYGLIENGELGFIRFDERSIKIPMSELKKWMENKITYGIKDADNSFGTKRKERVGFDALDILMKYNAKKGVK